MRCRVDYFRGVRTNQREMNQRSEGWMRFVLTYPNDPMYGTAYSPTHTLYDESYARETVDDRSFASSSRGSTRRVEIRDARGEVTLLIPTRRSAAAAISLLANAPGNDDGFALLTLSPPAVRPRAVPRDLTFVIDVSGSMSGEKMRQARQAGKQFLQSLSSMDRFRLIDFSSDVRTFRDNFSTASRENIRAAERYLDDLDAEGSTNISGALEEALSSRVESGRLPIILFLTDGHPTVGERDASVIAANVAKQRGSRRLFTFGVGADLNVSLIEQIALEGRGTASFVRPEESVERAVAIVASRLTSPLVTDVRIRADGVRLRKMHPSGSVDIFAGEDLVVLARYDGSGNAVVRFEGQTTNGPVSWSTRLTFSGAVARESIRGTTVGYSACRISERGEEKAWWIPGDQRRDSRAGRALRYSDGVLIVSGARAWNESPWREAESSVAAALSAAASHTTWHRRSLLRLTAQFEAAKVSRGATLSDERIGGRFGRRYQG